MHPSERIDQLIADLDDWRGKTLASLRTSAGLTGSTWRAIDVFEGDKINAPALKMLIQAAVAFNRSKLKKKAPPGTGAKVRKAKKT